MDQKRTLKLAAIGVGGIWAAHAKNLALLGGNKVVAVCDLNETQRQKAGAELGAREYSTIQSLMDGEPELDAVISCTPPMARREVVEAAAQYQLNTGWPLPVFVEKPPAFSLDDARAITALSRPGGVPVAVGFMYRYFPIVDKVRELLADRPIHLVQSTFFCPAATKWALPSWFYIKERSGGHILDQAVHSMDLIRFLAGDITQVHTLGNNISKPKSETFTIEESSSTNLRFASGASGAHLHSWAHDEFKVRITLIGEDYQLHLALDDRLSGFIGDRQIEQQAAPAPEGASHHYEEMRAFLSGARNADYSTMRSPYHDAARSLATVLAMNESIETGLPVDVASVD